MSDIPSFCVEVDNERPCVVCGKMTKYVEVGVEHDNERPCVVCGKMTKYVEVGVEQPLCSDVCIDKFYEMIYGREVL